MEDKCNLALYTEKKAKTSAYDKLVAHARDIAEGMSMEDKERLQKTPTPEMLKNIMDRNYE